MSTASQVAVLAEAGRGGVRGRDRAATAGERPLIRLTAFAALGLYGVLRWAALLNPAPGDRLLGLLVLAVAVAGLGGALATRSHASRAVIAAAATVGTIVALLAAMALSGVPVAWIRHVRITVTADGIGAGLSGLPRAVVPYSGINDWVRTVIVLGAGVLLLDAALVLALTTTALGDLRRAGAALPLVALAVVPMTLVRPELPYVQGMLLFALLAAFIWGERIRAPELATGGGDRGACRRRGDRRRAGARPAQAVAELRGAGGDARARPRRDVQLEPDLRAAQLAPDRARDLRRAGRASGLLEGRGPGLLQWLQLGPRCDLPARSRSPDRPAQPLREFTQTIQVTIRALDTTDLIAAGVASAPATLRASACRNNSGDLDHRLGYATWRQLPRRCVRAGGRTRPVRSERRRAGTRRRGDPARDVPVPDPCDPGPRRRRRRAAQRCGGGVRAISLWQPGGVRAADARGSASVTSSPYARAFALAQQLARRAPTPYAFAQSVLRYLSTGDGFVYSEHPPSSRYPLEGFLFTTKTGYCQQFSGAMAMLLRMGGVPARVGAGFTTGTYDSATKQYVVSDTDAHDWVEAWMPGYGWVTFDPTPASAPARGGHAPAPAIESGPAGVASVPLVHHQDLLPGPTSAVKAARPRGSSGLATTVEVLLAVALAAGLLVVLAWRLAAAGGADQLIELERALRRCGRPMSGGVTLAALERRLGSSGDAAAYIKAIRLERFGGGPPPTPQQRRALRAQLRAGLGLTGAVRALWALPPRWPFTR